MNFDFGAVSVNDAAQVAILYLAIYAILKSARGSRFGQALLGVGVLAALAALFTFVFHFDVLSQIVRWVLMYLALSTVVIFQPEIRRILAAVGAFGTFERPKYSADGAAEPEFVVATVMKLADLKMGALIAFERGISLRGYEETGVRLDALFTRELVQSVFTPPLPLHDGGMTMRNGRISSAHCIFPVSNNFRAACATARPSGSLRRPTRSSSWSRRSPARCPSPTTDGFYATGATCARRPSDAGSTRR